MKKMTNKEVADNKIVLAKINNLSLSKDISVFESILHDYLVLAKTLPEYRQIISSAVGNREDKYFELVDISNPELRGEKFIEYCNKWIKKTKRETE
jgi:hypothetical protein